MLLLVETLLATEHTVIHPDPPPADVQTTATCTYIPSWWHIATTRKGKNEEEKKQRSYLN